MNSRFYSQLQCVYIHVLLIRAVIIHRVLIMHSNSDILYIIFYMKICLKVQVLSFVALKTFFPLLFTSFQFSAYVFVAAYAVSSIYRYTFILVTRGKPRYQKREDNSR